MAPHRLKWEEQANAVQATIEQFTRPIEPLTGDIPDRFSLYSLECMALIPVSAVR